MSDLTATNCGCGCENSCENRCENRSIFGNGNCGCSIIWIILLLCCCGNNGMGMGCDNGCGNGCGNNSCWWIILLLLFCNGDCGCGSIF